MSQRRVDTPVAPPAFPSIPLGMAVKTGDQISFQELEDELGPDTARDLVAQTDPEMTAAPVAPAPAAPPPRSSTLPIIAGALAAVVLLGGLATLLVIAVAIGLVVATG